MTDSSESGLFQLSLVSLKRFVVSVAFFAVSGILFGIIGDEFQLSAPVVIVAWLILNMIVLNIYMHPVKERWRELSD